MIQSMQGVKKRRSLEVWLENQTFQKGKLTTVSKESQREATLYILDIIYCGLRHAPCFRNEENIINVTLPFVHNRLLESNRSLRV